LNTVAPRRRAVDIRIESRDGRRVAGEWFRISADDRERDVEKLSVAIKCIHHDKHSHRKEEDLPAIRLFTIIILHTPRLSLRAHTMEMRKAGMMHVCMKAFPSCTESEEGSMALVLWSFPSMAAIITVENPVCAENQRGKASGNC